MCLLKVSIALWIVDPQTSWRDGTSAPISHGPDFPVGPFYSLGSGSSEHSLDPYDPGDPHFLSFGLNSLSKSVYESF